MIDDATTIRNMAEYLKKSPSMKPTEAFRLVFRASANEQSEEAARKRCLRKFKIYRKSSIGHSTPEVQHIWRNQIGTFDHTNRVQTNLYSYENAFQLAAMQINNLLAHDAIHLAIGSVDFGGANNALEKALAQMNNHSVHEAMQLAISTIDFDGMSSVMDKVVKKMETIANRF